MKPISVFHEIDSRALTTAAVAAAIALATGIVSVQGHAPFGSVDGSIAIWILETVIILSGVAVAFGAVTEPGRPVNPHLLTVFCGALFGLLAVYLTGTGWSSEAIALAFSVLYTVVFRLLPIENRAAGWLALVGGAAGTVGLLGAEEAGVLHFALVWLALMAILWLCVGAPVYLRIDRAASAPPPVENTSKDRMFAIINHEMRTPLNAITGLCSLLAKNPKIAADPDLANMVDHMQSAGHRLARLMRDMVDFEEAGLGRLALEIHTFNLAAVIHEVLAEHEQTAREYSVRLEAPALNEGDVLVLGDAGRTEQILDNLVSNGIKFNRMGGSVTISLRFQDNRVTIMVADTGCGIAPEKQHRLFTMFDRLDREKGAIPGEGIGLALCKRLAEAMNGRIAVESSSSEGTVFIVELPQPDRDQPMSEPEGKLAAAG